MGQELHFPDSLIDEIPEGGWVILSRLCAY
jgi:hypothetical protein